MAFIPEASPNLAQEKQRNSRVNDLPRDNFQFAWNPRDWQVDAEGNMVPTIVHLSKSPGVNGVGKDGDFEPAAARYRKQGWKLIPHDVLGADLDYVTPYKNRKGKMVHRTLFQKPYNTSEDITDWAFDREAWTSFIQLLRKRNIITQPEPAIVRGWVERKEAEVHQLRTPPTNDGPAMRRYEEQSTRLNLQLEGLKREYEVSIGIYGAPASSARSRIADLLANAVGVDPEEQALIESVRGEAPRSKGHPLQDLGLRHPLTASLIDAGIESPQDLSMLSAEDLLALDGVGPKSIDQIDAALLLQGMALTSSTIKPEETDPNE